MKDKIQDPTSAQSSLLEMKNIIKSYGKLKANDEANLLVHAGEIHAVLGENGAGKSTLLKIIYGAERLDSGKMTWKGQQLDPSAPNHANSVGICMVFQHFSLFETLTVVENITLTVKLPPDEIRAQILDLGARYGWHLEPDASVYSLSYGERQQIEIIRCLLKNPTLLIMDEPTSVLSPKGVEKLFVTLRQLAEEGRSILFTSHKLDEVKVLCHSATIMRGGKTIATTDPAVTSTEELARLMIGSQLPSPVHAEAKPASAPVLKLAPLSYTPEDPFGRSLDNVELEVFPGEVVGIAGVSGNGQKELVDLIVGEVQLPKTEAAKITFDGKSMGAQNIGWRRRAGLAFIAEERFGRATIPELSLLENGLLTASHLGLVKNGLINRNKLNEITEEWISRFDVRCSGPEAEAQSLSGGNLQKFIAAREIGTNPKLLVAVQPTWGLDVAAAFLLRQTMVDLREKNVGVLIVSDELTEIMEISDRVYVINRGELSESLPVRSTNISKISELMTAADDSKLEGVL